MCKDSEETEVKDLEWAKKEITSLADNQVSLNSYHDGQEMGLRMAVGVLDQVEQPEKPTIPNYVAKWISEHHERFDLYPALRRLENGSTRDYSVYKWYRVNTLDFVVAYLTGEYEIEQEPKTYRFTQNAFMEQDFTASSYEEAEKMAQAEWKRMFEKEGLFGEPEFEEELEE